MHVRLSFWNIVQLTVLYMFINKFFKVWVYTMISFTVLCLFVNAFVDSRQIYKLSKLLSRYKSIDDIMLATYQRPHAATPKRCVMCAWPFPLLEAAIVSLYKKSYPEMRSSSKVLVNRFALCRTTRYRNNRLTVLLANLPAVLL